MIAPLFLLAGFGKLAAPAATKAYIASAGLPLPDISYLAALAVEIGGGLLLLAGYRTRPVALGLAFFTLVTALVFHHDFADQNQMTHFLKNLAITGGLLQYAAFGAGILSIDAARGRA